MSDPFKKRLKGASIYVLFFGFFVAGSLILQCLIPFLQLMAELNGNGEWAWFLTIFNARFNLPMEMISNFWAAISAAYVGLDRAAFSVDAFKNGNQTTAFTEEKIGHLKQVMVMSFFIYLLAVGLNSIFDADLALTPLFVSFGSTVLFYVSGNKVVSGFQKAHPESEIEKLTEDCLKDMSEEQLMTMKKLSDIVKEGKTTVVKLENNYIVGMKC